MNKITRIQDALTSFQNWGRQQNERLQAFAAQLAKSPEAQNRLGFAAALLLALVVFVLAQPAPNEYVLEAPVVFKLHDPTGREIGAMTAKAGTKVRVIAEDETSRTLNWAGETVTVPKTGTTGTTPSKKPPTGSLVGNSPKIAPAANPYLQREYIAARLHPKFKENRVPFLHEPYPVWDPNRVCHTLVPITLERTREGGPITYPAGTKCYVLAKIYSQVKGKTTWQQPIGKSDRMVTITTDTRELLLNQIIMIGETREQCEVPWEAIQENFLPINERTGKGTKHEVPEKALNQPPVSTTSIQYPAEFCRVNDDGPEGNFSGVPLGNEVYPGNPELEHQIFDEINRVRAEHGLPPYIWDEGRARMARYNTARLYVQDLYMRVRKLPGLSHAGYNAFIHTNGSIEILTREASNARRFGVKTGGDINGCPPFRPDVNTAQEAVKGWMNSWAHRGGILSKEDKYCGVGTCHGPNRDWVVASSSSGPTPSGPIPTYSELP